MFNWLFFYNVANKQGNIEICQLKPLQCTPLCGGGHMYSFNMTDIYSL